jgi:signal transduction histidine kinase
MSAPDPTTRAPRPSLKRELLLNFALIAGAAISLAVLTALVAQVLQPGLAVVGLILMIVADVAVLFLFGRYLLEKLVLHPLGELVATADDLASGDLAARATPAATEELTHLGERFNRMTEHLIEVQAELVRAEKLATVGRLAAGVAHEVGNPLSAIGTYLEVLRKRGADPEIMTSMERETARIDRIVRGLLAYARPREDQAGEVDVGAVIGTAIDLLTQQGTVAREVVSIDVRPDLPTVHASVHGLEQVVVNLLLNAVDAAPGGPIAVGADRLRYRGDTRSERRYTDPSGAMAVERRVWNRPSRPEIADGTRGVLVWVADSGPGIRPEDRHRVFDPFFTTKPPGHGTGLGLAIVEGTVHEMGGLVWVDASREGGAAFKVFLPTDRETPR